nr:protein FRA10AC1 [Pogona vitticeps]
MEPPEMKLSSAILGHGGYDSDFSDDETGGQPGQWKNRVTHRLSHMRIDLLSKLSRNTSHKVFLGILEKSQYARHKKFVNDYILYYGGNKEDFRRSGVNDKTDLDIVRENHRFLWREEDEADMNWEKRLSKKYYDKLFKEYCIADLSKYKENKFGFRWRHEKEVISGKGQFSCGNKHCDEKEGLKSWEVNFGYVEHGEKKNALVKLRLCPECSYKLNFHHRRKEVKPTKKRKNTEQSSKMLKCKRSKLCSSHRHKSKKKESAEDQVSSEEFDSTDQDSDNGDQQDGPSEADYWKGPPQDAEEKTQDEEFDEYFQDLFL